MNLKSVKNRLKDETLDLSLCDLKEVPVREIATIKKAAHLDLSNNLLTSLPSNFVDLKQIVKLDLSRNMLTEIPENFGELKQLKYLDLYANEVDRLPLSLSELKNLKWLDLKENPLTPAVATVAGPCSNLSECQACARNIVKYLSQVKLSIEEERLRRLNAITADTDADTVSSKKGGKKKKKKLVDKNNKQNLDKNGSNCSSEALRIDETKIKTATLTHTAKHTNKERIFQETGTYRFFVSTIVRLFLFGLIFLPTIVILPLYSKQSELFMNYIERNTGVPLNAFQKHSTDMVESLTRIAVNAYNYLYYVYEKNFQTKTDIPVTI
ncbi:Leucine-rich repeat-containing protein 59 [Habropoda laboriosa]|uniref:Leucine-rich repeat-containing protein 59 n=1 Tax=Habropoda laboriosa TaxID=597456 RepID=A0A0L7QS77_9HYME|nr:Leucine-rich repeat-containing protein 59 [Habropoda laboriosa]